MPHEPSPITALLSRWSDGDADAFPALMGLAYDDLRAIAHRRLRAAGSHETLSTTALVHEVYLRLEGRDGGSWESRARFYAFAARAMRHILVDHARRRGADKRGGNSLCIPFEDAHGGGGGHATGHATMDATADAAADAAADVLGTDEALEKLATLHPRMASIVELRFFGGLTVPETADALGTSVRTVEREWTRARAYLLEVLSPDEHD